MKNSLEYKLGIFVALAVIAAVLILEMVGGVERFASGNHLQALFGNIHELKIGDRVKMGGVEIGRVETIGFTNDNKVVVQMKVRKKLAGMPVQVHTDSIATIKFTGLMGQNFVEISFGTSSVLAGDGAVLQSSEQADLNAIIAKLDNVATGVENITKTFSGDQISNLLGPFTDFLKANRGPLTATIANMQTISGQIARGEGTVGKLIMDDSLYTSALVTVSNLQSTTDDIKLTIGDARKVLDDVNSGRGTVGKLVKDETLYNETTASMTNLKEILQKINNGQGSIGKLVNDQEFYRNAKLTLQKLDKATEGLEDQGPLSVMGLAVNSLF